jgi:hypothetical protein
MKETQPHPVAHRERAVVMFLAVGRLVQLLSLFEAVVDLGDELVACCQLLINHQNVCVPGA